VHDSIGQDTSPNRTKLRHCLKSGAVDYKEIMNINLFIAFLFGMIILAAIPGPGVFASMAKAISEGLRASLYFIGGLVTGDILFLLLALFGLAAIAKIWGGMFLFIKIIGGIYLMYLGIKVYQSIQIQTDIEAKYNKNRFQTFMSGLLVTLGNPKPILFYASVLPTIINFNEVRPLDILIMMMLIALVSFSVLGTYCYIASLSKKINMSNRWQKRISQVARLVMITVGIFIIAK
jgi:threonine/homoserine/homoserine lactone efflux protein